MERSLNRIASLLADGLIDEALSEVEALDMGVMDDETLVEALCLRGDVLAQAGRLDEALDDFEEAHQMDPDNVLVLAGLGKVYALEHRFSEAEACLEQALELAPDGVVPRFNLAMTLMYQRHYADAIEEFSKLVLEDQIPPDVYIQWGFAHYEMGEYAQAIERFQQAVKMDPEDGKTHIWIGNAWSELRRWSEAEAAFQRARKLSPHDAEVYLYWAMMLQHQDRLSEADRLVQAALDLEAGAADLWSLRGRIARQGRKLDLADEYFVCSLNCNPLWSDGLSGLASTALDRGHVDEARRYAYDALRCDCYNEEALDILRQLNNNSRPNLQFTVTVGGIHRCGYQFTRDFFVLAHDENEAVRFVEEIEQLCDDDYDWRIEEIDPAGEWLDEAPGVVQCGVYHFYEYPTESSEV